MVYSMSQWLDKQKEKERQISCLFAVIISVFCGHQDTQSLNKKKKKNMLAPSAFYLSRMTCSQSSKLVNSFPIIQRWLSQEQVDPFCYYNLEYW